MALVLPVYAWSERVVMYFTTSYSNDPEPLAHYANVSDPGEIRTFDPLIKSQLLYQLSYGVIALSMFLSKGIVNIKEMEISWPGKGIILSAK